MYKTRDFHSKVITQGIREDMDANIHFQKYWRLIMRCFSFFPGSFSSSVPWDDDRFLFLFVLHQKCDLAAITIGKMVDLVSSSHETNMHFNLNA